MKIAIITSGFLPVVDGVTITGYARVRELSKQGHQVKLFCPDYSKLAAIYPNWQEYRGEIFPGVEVISLPSTPFFVEFERNVAWYAYPHLERELVQFQPDIIHVDEPERLFVGLWRIPGLRYARQHHIPCVSFFRTNFIEYLEDFFPLPRPLICSLEWVVKRLVLSVYNAYDLTLVTSKITNKKIQQLGIQNSCYGSFLGLDSAKFNNLQPQEDFFASQYKLPQLDNKIKIVFLGRLTPEKGWNFTLNNLEYIFQTIDKERVAFLIIGDGELKSTIQAKFAELVPCYHLFGRVEPEKIPELLVNSDLHVTTSEKETRGLTILEAFSAGIPVLAPNSEGVIENIESGINGFLYQPGNPEDFRNKLNTLITNDELRQQMGKAGRAGIKNKYSWDITINNLLQVWQQQIAIKEDT